MPIRLAQRADIPEMSNILAAAFTQDKLLQVMFPNQVTHPEDYVDGFRTRLVESWWDYSRILMVSYTAESGSKEIITGLCEWERVGIGREKVWGSVYWWHPRRLISMPSLVPVQNRIGAMQWHAARP
jgi:hypothetical protein